MCALHLLRTNLNLGSEQNVTGEKLWSGELGNTRYFYYSPMQKNGGRALERFSSQKFHFEIFLKTNVISITFGPRYIHGQSLKEIYFPTLNAVDRFYRDCLLINWVKTFYRNIESCVINDGLTSDYFTLARGVRRGDPRSPYLFLLVIETLAISTRKNTEIEGIKIGNNETKVLQYGDDTTAALSNLDSANAFFQQLDLFQNLCGLEKTVQKQKCEDWVSKEQCMENHLV